MRATRVCVRESIYWDKIDELLTCKKKNPMLIKYIYLQTIFIINYKKNIH